MAFTFSDAPRRMSPRRLPIRRSICCAMAVLWIVTAVASARQDSASWGTEPPASPAPAELSQPTRIDVRLVWATPARGGSPDLSSADPLSLAAGDFDADGTPDLAVGLEEGDGGLLVLYRGNPAAVYPHSPAAERMRERGVFTTAPFLSPARVLELPEAPYFLGAGDFDNDGNVDVVAGRRNGSRLHFALGDGEGRFPSHETMDLGGQVSAAAIGEVNRADGIADLVVAIERSGGAMLTVYQGPRGVLSAEGEEIALAAKATSIALGRLDEDRWIDVEATVGDELVRVRGRDRWRSVGRGDRSVTGPVVDRIRRAAAAARDRGGSHAPLGGDPVALLEMRLSPDTTDDLVALVEGSTTPLVLERAPARGGGGAYRVNQFDQDIGPLGDGLCDNDLQLEGEQCTLYEALEEAKRLSTGAASITFESPGTYPGRMGLGNLISVPLSIDATEHMGAGAPGVEIQLYTSIRLGGAGSSVRGVLLAGQGLQFFSNAGGNVFESNWVGIDTSGSAPNPWGGTDVSSLNAQTTFGGTGSGAGNLFAGDSQLSSNSDADVIQGNLFGTDSSGTMAVGSPGFQQPVGLNGDNAVFGGSSAGARNVVSGNERTHGVAVSASGVLIQGNYVGTDSGGTAALGNNGTGILTQFGADDVTIGGTAPGAGNVVSANLRGGISVGGAGAAVQGNLVGTDAAGTSALGNTDFGVAVAVFDVTVGGDVLGAGNVIVDTRLDVNDLFGDGVWLSGPSAHDVFVQGNQIGVTWDSVPLGNAGSGVRIWNGAASNLIGGAFGENEIAHNGGAGVLLEGGAGSGNLVLENLIYDNALLGIDISFTFEPDGPNNNDPGDGDGGANNRQNHPLITFVDPATGDIDGFLNSTAQRDFRIELFANQACYPSGCGEGVLFLDSTVTSTNPQGDGAFSFSIPGITNPSVTATDILTGDTSEFSNCFPAEPTSVVNSVGDAADLDFTEGLGPGDGLCYTGGVVDRDGTPEPECTLRAALQEQELLPRILFDVPPSQFPGFGVPAIQPLSELPPIEHPLTLDATSQPGAQTVEVDGFRADPAPARRAVTTGGRGGVCGPSPDTIGLRVNGSGTTILGLTVYCFGDAQIELAGGGGHLVAFGVVGTDIDRVSGLGGQAGIRVLSSQNDVVGNTIAGADTGVVLAGAGATQNLVQSNDIGTDGQDAAGIGNRRGVAIVGASQNTLDGNTIRGNTEDGVVLDQGATNNTLIDNEIGNSESAGGALTNGRHGVLVRDSSSNRIGIADDGNRISGNQADGVRITGLSAQNTVRGNRIGTDAEGDAARGNGGDGVSLHDIGLPGPNIVGGTAPGDRNVISANQLFGVYVNSTTGSSGGASIWGNHIGIDAVGDSDLGNGLGGVGIRNTSGNRIGGVGGGTGVGNVISGNGEDGVLLVGDEDGAGSSFAFDNGVLGNWIGTGGGPLGSTFGLGNDGAGIRIRGAHGTWIADNIVRFNFAQGVTVETGAGAEIVDNSISSNSGLGIDLKGPGENAGTNLVTANDPGDLDAGPNTLQNFPTITSAEQAGIFLTIRGNLQSTPNQSYRIDLYSVAPCDPSGHGEGHEHLGSVSVALPAAGVGAFELVTLAAPPAGTAVTATATRTVGSGATTLRHTSEFSNCQPIEAIGPGAVWINEVDATTSGGPDDTQFVELSAPDGGVQPLGGKVLVLYGGSTDTVYEAIDLDGFFTDAGGRFVLGNAAVANVDLVFDDGLLLAGPAAVALYQGDATDYPAGAPVSTEGLIDALVYGPETAQDAGLLVLLEAGQPQVDEAGAGEPAAHSNQRCPDGSGGGRFTDTYAQAPPTPGAENQCVVCELAPPISTGEPGDGHTLDATVLTDRLTPAAGAVVDFAVLTGPNAGGGSSTNTDAAGVASFQYTSDGREGRDLVEAGGGVDGVPFVCRATRIWGAGWIFGDGFDLAGTAAWSTSVGEP